ncbi:virulence protein RhuM/Fic/DOC family protein [Pasteurella atlantica]|uniref:Virulence protein RhuM/Fic/DOC family protein n=3 Tax=Pasteurellaceae TaxID=712 RepID=A0AAJ6P1Y3_9PAST|nr:MULTISPECIES: virulence protein RhuM/Fic/DOC family protein [Pasteurella]MDP8051717.1 virulence protein RhuM/Fic/DOC family protein [Pasteurella atlantica]MDP8104960.1 virulence protein RhuM/Fic/DOC family protein [Pasteurella atlantica]MDP8148375.1 virulence protein RhuM/Fic/DOC family protein [Pasteurella atlantica]MDP8170372.1 virulence protein RhuM/Fic/DOC family protein [Pasteurella skyensis]MDP8174227.1 virulence protein RhuM/Fic/DOC family protein [Pasteurella skyensis]
MQSDLLIYKDDNGNVAIDVRLEDETVWLSQVQMAELFEKDVRTINEHIKNVFNEQELEEIATIRKFRIVRQEGSRQIKREIEHYNLDMIISIGYRVKSRQGVAFRRWATSRLKDYLIKGYAINQQRLLQNSQELQQALALIQKTANSSELTVESGRGLVDIVSRYTQTFLWLQQYDEGLLTEPKTQLGGELPSVEQARIGLSELKQQLISRGEASELFGRERDDGLSAILGNLSQSVFGEPAYPSIEEKAAHLLYFIVKNHPFSDGNKRSGAFLFVDFLHRNNRLFNTDGNVVINDTGLAALTLLVAESDPKQKETLIKLIIHMLKK